MPTRILRLSAGEVVSLLRAETEAAYGQPELNTTISKEYIIAEDFDRRSYNLQGGEEFDLVTAVAILTVEPRVERDYWVLRITVERPLGPLLRGKEDALERKELTLDEFEAELHAADPARITARLICETAHAKRHFDKWLADVRRRHPMAEAG